MNIKDFTKENTTYFLGEVKYVHNLSKVMANKNHGMNVYKGVFAKLPESDLVLSLDKIDDETKLLMADFAIRSNKSDERFVYSLSPKLNIGDFYVVPLRCNSFTGEQQVAIRNFHKMIASLPDNPDAYDDMYHIHQ